MRVLLRRLPCKAAVTQCIFGPQTPFTFCTSLDCISESQEEPIALPALLHNAHDDRQIPPTKPPSYVAMLLFSSGSVPVVYLKNRFFASTHQGIHLGWWVNELTKASCLRLTWSIPWSMLSCMTCSSHGLGYACSAMLPLYSAITTCHVCLQFSRPGVR